MNLNIVSTIPWHITLFCVLSISGLFITIFRTIAKHNKPTNNNPSWMIKLVVGSLLLYAVHFGLSISGFYSNFSLPPRFPLAVVLSLALFLLVGFSTTGFSILQSIGTEKLILFQVWRILPETLILLLIQAQLMPE